MESWIAADNHWALWAILLSAGAFGVWAERTRWGSKLSGAVIAIGAAAVLSNLGLIPSAPETQAYDITWSFLVPLAIPLLLFQADIVRILREAGPTLLAFTAGGIGTVLGTVLAFHLVPLGDEGWKMAGIFCATYVGGSMNFVAVAEALELQSGDLKAAGFAADNLMMAIYFVILFALPSWAWLRRAIGERRVPAVVCEEEQEETAEVETAAPLGLDTMAIGLAVSGVLCAIGYWFQSFTGLKGSAILCLTALAVALATVFPRRMARLSGCAHVGNVLMHVFFAVIGASANIVTVLRVGPLLFVFAAVILTVHLLTILLAARVLRVDLAEMVIASNANMGGPTTAAAMAVARRWNALVTPAILCGTLGYAIATFVGVAVGKLLG